MLLKKLCVLYKNSNNNINIREMAYVLNDWSNKISTIFLGVQTTILDRLKMITTTFTIIKHGIEECQNL